jgi:hypothetical protein
MGDHRLQATVLGVGGHKQQLVVARPERHLDQHAVGAAERVATEILVEQGEVRRQLEAEAELETGPRRQLGERGANLLLPRARQRQVRPDVRCREEHARAVSGCLPAENRALRDGAGTVVARRANMRVAVDEARCGHSVQRSG